MPTKRTRPASGATSSASSAEAAAAADRAVRFFNNLTHTGDYSGEPFALRPWQEAPIRRLFGTLRPNGARQFTKTFWGFPRKQGKTEVVAAGALYLLMGQGRPNQRIYTGAGDKEQAALIFRAAADMIRNDPVLEARTVIYDGAMRIEYPAGRSMLQVLSSVPKSKHGLGPTAVLIDEFHVVDEELVNVLTTGFGARKDPLTWMITTAGWDRHSLCWDEWQYALNVRDGKIDDPTYLPVLFAADPGDDWTSEATWRKAMPALGDFCSLDFIRDEFRKARERPRFENTFKQLYLNLWTEQATRWLSVDRWGACSGAVDPAELRGRPCYAGLDLSQTRDLSALAVLWDLGDRLALTTRFWAPEDGVWRSEASNRKLYPQWARSKHLTLTPGEVIDYDAIEAEVVALLGRQDLRQLLADLQGALHLCLRLRDIHGLKVDFLPQTPYRLNDPARELERRILAGTIVHDGNPVMDHCVANAVVHENRTGLIIPDKAKAAGRIDGVAATIDAIAAQRGQVEQAGTVKYTGIVRL